MSGPLGLDGFGVLPPVDNLGLPVIADRYGLPLSTSSAVARDAYVAGCDCIFSAVAGAETHLATAIEADPAFALAHAALARTHFIVAKVAEARKAAEAARLHAASATARERGHVDALCLAMEGKPVDALAATRAHLREHPRDAMVAAPATGVFGLIGFSGRQNREVELIDFLRTLQPHMGDDWWFQTVYAFALCETGKLGEALRVIERSLAGNPRSGHGAHVKAHVLYEIGEDRASLDFLTAWMPSYSRDGTMHCHLSWHLALHQIALGFEEEAWRTYRAQVHPGGSWGPSLNTVTDSVSFLWRGEIDGHARHGELWAQVRDYASERFPNSGIAFADVHRALACIATGDQTGLSTIVDELKQRLAAARYPAGDVVLKLISGLDAYEARRWSDAAHHLEAALSETVRIGGSRAQRDLVEHTLIAAYLKDGRAAESRAVIARRADRHPGVAVAGFSA